MDEEHEIALLQIFEEEPHVGQHEVGRRVGISQSSVCRSAKENKFHLYHITLVQELKEADYRKRLNFCRFIPAQIPLDQFFFWKICFAVMKHLLATMGVQWCKQT
jgi:hypothetical protein